MRPRPLLLALSFLLASCGGEGDRADGECARTARSFVRILEGERGDAALSLPASGPLALVPGDPDPLAEPRWLGPRLPLWVISDEELMIDGRGVGGLSEELFEATMTSLTQDLRALVRARLRLGGEEEPLALWLWAPPGLPVAELTRILRALPESILLYLLVREPLPEAAVPPDAAPLETAAALRDHLRARLPVIAAGCPALAELDRALFRTGRQPEPAFPSSRLRRAIAGCGCVAVDLEGLLGLYRLSAWGPEGPLRRIPRPLRFGGCARPEIDASEVETIEALSRRAARLSARVSEAPICVGDL